MTKTSTLGADTHGKSILSVLHTKKESFQSCCVLLDECDGLGHLQDFRPAHYSFAYKTHRQWSFEIKLLSGHHQKTFSGSEKGCSYFKRTKLSTNDCKILTYPIKYDQGKLKVFIFLGILLMASEFLYSSSSSALFLTRATMSRTSQCNTASCLCLCLHPLLDKSNHVKDFSMQYGELSLSLSVSEFCLVLGGTGSICIYIYLMLIFIFVYIYISKRKWKFGRVLPIPDGRTDNRI